MPYRSLLIRTVGGLIALAAIQAAEAADLPVAPEPVDYVRVCDVWGSGFYYVPGTDTCLRVAGRIRVDYNAFDFNEEFAVLSGNTFGTAYRGTNAYRWRARAYIYMDSRTNTEFGLLRTYTEIRFNGDTAAARFSDRALKSGGGWAVGAIGDTDGDPPGIELFRAFIQYGGFTLGRTQSFYDFLDATYAAEQFFNPNYSDRTLNALAYTFIADNGFSASISLEDEAYRRAQLTNLAASASAAADPAVYAGNRYPDLVGNIRYDAAFGTLQIMAAGHNVESVQGLGPGNEGKYGFAVGGGVNINLPLPVVSSAGVQATYAKGALLYANSKPVGGTFLANGAPLVTGDAVVLPDGSLELTEAVSVSGGFSSAITPTISFGFQAGYLSVTGPCCGDVDGDGLLDDGDYENVDLQAVLGYTIGGLVLALGAEYKRVIIADDAFIDPVTAQLVEIDDPEGLSLFFRAQRTF